MAQKTPPKEKMTKEQEPPEILFPIDLNQALIIFAQSVNFDKCQVDQLNFQIAVAEQAGRRTQFYFNAEGGLVYKFIPKDFLHEYAPKPKPETLLYPKGGK